MNNRIKNVELLEGVFGRIPSFHDAEVLTVTLDRKYNSERTPTMSALIRAFSSTGAKYDVQITFIGLFGLKLENFNQQNVLGSLSIEQFKGNVPDNLLNDVRLKGFINERTTGDLRFYVKFDYCFGVEADLFCNTVVIDTVTAVENNL